MTQTLKIKWPIPMISSHNTFSCCCFFFPLEFGPDKAYSVFSDIPTQSTIFFSLLSEQNGKREEGEKKIFIPWMNCNEWILAFLMFSTQKSQIQPNEVCDMEPVAHIHNTQYGHMIECLTYIGSCLEFKKFRLITIQMRISWI